MLRHYQGRFYSVPLARHGGAYSVLVTHDNLCKGASLKQVVVAAIVILSIICRAWTMYLCIDSGKFLSEALGAFILWGTTILTQLGYPFGGTSIRQGTTNKDITVLKY